MEGHVFKNWAQTYSCSPELYFEPQNLQELRQILAKARVNKKAVKVVGNGHSPSDISCTHGYMISLKNFNNILDVNNEEQTIKVEAGILLSKLNDVLYENGLGLSVLGSVSDISLAGAIATGTHGTGKTFSAMNGYVLELDVLLSNGELLSLTSKDEELETFHAACLNLGSLGIILNVKLQCEPAFKLRQVQYAAPLKDLVENIDVHLSASDHFRFMWFPHTDGCVAYHSSRTDERIHKSDSWFWDYFIGYIVLEFIYWISTFIPRLVPAINRLFYRVFSRRQVTVDRSDRVFNFNCLFQQYVMEWAVPRDQMGVVLTQLKAWIENNFYAHFPIEVRFVKQDNSLLSLAQATDVCYINIIMYRPYGKDVPHDQYFDEFQTLMMKAGGRPHWAKDFKLTQDQIRSIHPHWNRFAAIRSKLDPDRMFTNEKLKLIFGD